VKTKDFDTWKETVKKSMKEAKISSNWNTSTFHMRFVQKCRLTV